MLAKKQRLDRKTFAQAFSRGFFVSTHALSLRVFEYKSQCASKQSRFAIVVPSGVTKSKPVRNLLKRRGYSIIRTLLKPQTKFGISAIVFLKKQTKDMTFLELEAGMKELFSKAKLLN